MTLLNCCKSQQQAHGRTKSEKKAHRRRSTPSETERDYEQVSVFDTSTQQSHHTQREHLHQHPSPPFPKPFRSVTETVEPIVFGARPPSPHCHCSCHDFYYHRNRQSEQHPQEHPAQHRAQNKKSTSVSWSLSPSPPTPVARLGVIDTSLSQTRLRPSLKPVSVTTTGFSRHRDSPKNTSPFRVIGRYCRSPVAPFTPTFLYNTPVTSQDSTSLSSTASSNNYWDIRDLSHHPCRQRDSSPTQLYLLRLGSGRFPTMDLMQLDSRLIVFSLADTYTRLSPDRIFQDFIKTQSSLSTSRNVTVFNISEPLINWRDVVGPQIPLIEFGWPERHAPSLEKLCTLCKAIDSWLALDDERNVAVLYSKRDLSRSSLVVATFLHYIRISQSEHSSDYHNGASLDVIFDLDTMWAYFDQHLKIFLQPSQKRYIDYFTRLLSGEARINNRLLTLNTIVVRKIPNFDGNALCRPFVQIFQNLQLVHCSGVLALDTEYANEHDYFVFDCAGLNLRGEILVKCYHLTTDSLTTHHSAAPTSTGRIEMFSLQFHTGTQTLPTKDAKTSAEDILTFQRDDIDIAAYDKRFRPGTTVELYFNDTHLEHCPVVGVVDAQDSVTRRNSYELYFPDMEYTKGPIDGSLYATVSKKSQSPATVLSESDERKLDELLDEIFQEIESFPDTFAKHQKTTKLSDQPRLTAPVFEFPELTINLPVTSSSSVSNRIDTVAIEERQFTDDSDVSWLQRQKLKKQTRSPTEVRLIEELKGTLERSRDINGNIQPHSSYRQQSESVPWSEVPQVPERSSSTQISRMLKLDHASPDSNGHRSPYQRQWASTPPPSIVVGSRDGIRSLSPPLSTSDCGLDSVGGDISRTHTPSFPVAKKHPSLLMATDFHPQDGTVPMFIRDTSTFWYKPKITREDAVRLLMDKSSGTFLIRDSNSFRNAYGLALKVDPTIHDTSPSETVRHFLIESTSKGVQIKGCAEEPVFSSLAALVNQHSVTKISLPTRLVIPTEDIEDDDDAASSLARLYENGAGCNVVYFGSLDIEPGLSGPVAFEHVMEHLFTEKSGQIPTAIVNFKASNNGITLTDNSHRLFFRKHYPIDSLLYFELDPQNRSVIYEYDGNQIESAFFGFVARKKTSPNHENECLIFGQYEDDQPPIAIVDFVRKLRHL